MSKTRVLPKKDKQTGQFGLNNTGRPLGSKDKKPGARVQRASVRRLIERIVKKSPKKVTRTLKRGLFSYDPKTAFQYLQLATHMLDGKPVESVKMKFADETPRGSAHDMTKLSREELKDLKKALKKSRVVPEGFDDGLSSD